MLFPQMKGCEFPDGDSFAFMFACNGRGANMHGGKCHVESTLFRKHFPNTSKYADRYVIIVELFEIMAAEAEDIVPSPPEIQQIFSARYFNQISMRFAGIILDFI